VATRGKTRTRRPAKKAVDSRSLEAAIECARIADARRGEDIVVLHIEEKILVTDYFVLVSASNKRQIQAIALETKDYLSKKAGYRTIHVEGYEEAGWVLIDCGPVVVHVFREDLRSYYDLEMLWGDAPKVAWQQKKRGGKSKE